MLQLGISEGAEDMRVADDEAHIVQGGIASVVHHHAAPMQLPFQQCPRPLMQLHLHSTYLENVKPLWGGCGGRGEREGGEGGGRGRGGGG